MAWQLFFCVALLVAITNNDKNEYSRFTRFAIAIDMVAMLGCFIFENVL